MTIITDDDGIDMNLRHLERYEARRANMVFLGEVDLDLLAKQRETLHAVIDGINVQDAGSEETADHLSGLENLLDYIYDQLVPPGEAGNK